MQHGESAARSWPALALLGVLLSWKICGRRADLLRLHVLIEDPEGRLNMPSQAKLAIPEDLFACFEDLEDTLRR